MPWFPDIANPAFCETLHLRKIILERQRPNSATSHKVLEPGSAEFISALAAGSNSRRILHVGCGLSTIALAAAARATGGCLECVDTDDQRQSIVSRYVGELGLTDYVEFHVEKPCKYIALRDSFDFVLLTGEPETYITNFDLLRFSRPAIIVAYNALDDATNEYIKHVRQQPGMDSSTLPVGRGIEVSKILSWEAFSSGRKAYCYTETELFSEDDECTAAAGYSDCYFGTSSSNGFHGFVEHDDDRVSVYESASGTALNSATSSPGYDKDSFQVVHADDVTGTVTGTGTGSGTGTVSPAVSIGTSLEEESSRIHAVADEGEEELQAEESDISIQFSNVDHQTEVRVEGEDRQMLLSDITAALNDANVSVQGAKIATCNNRVEDVFYVVDAATKKQLDMDQQEAVRIKIMHRISERRQHQCCF